MEDKKNNSIFKLRVAEALQDDAYKGIARIDAETMKEIGVKRGDIVLIKGGKETVAIVDRAYPADVGEGIIRIDGILRRNAKTGVGESVSVKRAEVKEAKKILIAPAQKGIMVQADPDNLRAGLLGRAVVKGDIFVLGGTKRRRDAMGGGMINPNDIFGELFKELGDMGFGGEFAGFGGMGGGMTQIKFVVAKTTPEGPIIITENTEVQLSEKSVEVSEDSGKVLEVTYEDIGGLTEEIKKIREMVELPLRHPEIFERLGVEPPKGVLLTGPPGTGKTLLAKAVANESQANFFSVSGPEIFDKFYGESEKNIKRIFDDAEKNAPSIIFFDEIDAIAPSRDENIHSGEVERRVVSQLLTMMDGLKSRGKVIVIAATNRPDSIDAALRRPGRFDREVEINVPNKEGRLAILKIHTRNMPIEGTVYSDIIAANFSKQIEDYMEENKIELNKIQEKISQEKRDSEDQDIINKLKAKLFIITNRITGFQKIKKLIESKEELDILAEDLKEIYHTLELKNDSDARKKFVEKEKIKKDKQISRVLEEIKSLDLLKEEIWDRNSRFWNLIKSKGKEKDLDKLANITHGFVGADLAALAKESAMAVLRKVIPEMKLKDSEQIPKELIEKLKITHLDFEEALKFVRPSALREVAVETPNVRWTDIGGAENVKRDLNEAIEWPLKFPDSFKRLGIKPPRGLLLYGPPGTGKTLLAKAVAKESEANFIQVDGPELQKEGIVGKDTERLRKMFKRARQVAPCIIFFDEIDSFARRRGAGGGVVSDSHENLLNTLLTEMDGIEELKQVVVIAATNRPDMLDPALLRPGRFDRLVLVPVPDQIGRLSIFKIHTKNMPLENSVDLEELSEKTEGYSGADIESLCREAAMLALREDKEAKIVKLKHFENAMDKVPPSVSKQQAENYKRIESDYLKRAKAGLEKEGTLYLG